MKLTTLGLTGPQWIKRLEDKGFHMSSYAKDVLNSPDFKSCKAGEEHELVLVKISDIGPKAYYTTKEIQEYASKKGYKAPPPELACLVRESMTDKEIEALGVWWISVCHEPIVVDGRPHWLYADRHGDGGWLVAYWAGPDGDWHGVGAFFWAVSQVSTQSSDIGTKALEPLPLALESAIKIVKESGLEVYKKM